MARTVNLGFIGLGRMGGPIVKRLIAAGHVLAVFDVEPRATAVLGATSARVASDIADLARDSEIVFSCVPGPREVDAVMLGPHGLIAALRPGGTIVEMSTIGPAQGRALAEAASECGVGFLDAPLSGGEAGAAAGTLTATVGGANDRLALVQPMLACFCERVFHLGPSGSGYLAKAINQIIYLSYVASFSEAAALGARAGLDVPVLLEALRTSVAGHPLSMTHWDTRIASGDTTPGFHVRRVLKDLEVAQDACREQGFDADILFAVISAFREVAAAGFAESDVTALYQLKSGTLKKT